MRLSQVFLYHNVIRARTCGVWPGIDFKRRLSPIPKVAKVSSWGTTLSANSGANTGA